MRTLAVLATVSLASLPLTASAGAGVTLPLAGGDATIQSTRYSCDGADPFAVQYVNVGPNSLALLTLDKQDIVFVNVISGSGARYAAGSMEWWTKGEAATFTDTMKDDGKPQDCVQVP